MRLHEAKNKLDKNGAMLGKYITGPDAVDIEVQAELQRIKTNREMRAKSMVSGRVFAKNEMVNSLKLVVNGAKTLTGF